MKIAYKKQFDKFGYNPKSLGWVKGRQQLRFEALTKNIPQFLRIINVKFTIYTGSIKNFTDNHN